MFLLGIRTRLHMQDKLWRLNESTRLYMKPPLDRVECALQLNIEPKTACHSLKRHSTEKDVSAAFAHARIPWQQVHVFAILTCDIGVSATLTAPNLKRAVNS
jgi:hypothetical protein